MRHISSALWWVLLCNSVLNPFLHTLNVVQRLLTVAMSDLVCCFHFRLPEVLASSGTPISGEVNVAMAIFLLLFSSAHNPFLYTLNAVMQKYSGGIDFLATEFDYFCFAFQYV